MMYVHDATFTSGLQWQARPRSPLSASAPGSTQVLVWALAQKGQRRTCVLPAQVPRGCCGSGDFLLVVDSRPWWCGPKPAAVGAAPHLGGQCPVARKAAAPAVAQFCVVVWRIRTGA